jgi:archaellin
MLLIPYDTAYVQIYETYNWTSSYSDYLMANLITLIAGVSDESDMAQRPTNWAFQDANGAITGGAFLTSPGVIGTYTGASYFGTWFTEYNNYIGEAIIGGTNFVHALTQLTDDSLQPAYMVWNSGDGARDAMWGSMQWWNWGSGSQFTITPQVITYTGAIWTYSGYSSSNLTNLPPNLYYRMFEYPTYPNITMVTGGF